MYFYVVVGIEWSNDPESYAGSSIATGRVSHVRQIKGDDPAERGYRGPFVWGLGVRPTTSHRKLFCRGKGIDVLQYTYLLTYSMEQSTS